MRFSFKVKLITYFLIIFVLYTIGVIFLEQQENRKHRTEALQLQLDDYTELVHHYIQQNQLTDSTYTSINPIVTAMPEPIRVTIINNDGKVLYDKDVKNYNSLENHLDRVEIKGALYQGFGTNIRESSSTHKEYLYYAKYYNDYYVRIALPYDINVKAFLKADNYFIYTTIILFALVLVLVYIAVKRFNTSILNLKHLTQKVKRHEELPKDLEFTNDELGDIGKELVHILNQKEEAKLATEMEREKLRQHFQYSGEGLATFSPDFKREYVNTHFIQYANIISDRPIINVQDIFTEPSFSKVVEFIQNNKNSGKNSFKTRINKNAKTFVLQSIIFEDKSFELTIRDITEVEKNRMLKQEMTSNIAHELRTPVAAIRGFLETMHEQKLSSDKQEQFIEKAFNQSIRLSDLIDDISLLTKIEEQESSFEFDKVDMSLIVNNIQINELDKIAANGSKLFSNIKENTIVRGNYNLLLSVMQNMIENSIKYGGENIELHIDHYMEDSGFHYFTYYDTGKGVEEKHLTRIFERFYRVDEGRDRIQGGSGLGLSIVRNIIIIHNGSIEAKIHPSGGLQFLFKLPKSN